MKSKEYYDLLMKGHVEMLKQHRDDDLNNPPALRGGQSGCMYKGFVIGINPKEAVLRYLKLQSPTTFDERLLFDAGFGNEDSHNALLKAAGADFKCEEEIPISWTTDNGYLVTGRPDRALIQNGALACVIEEKQIASSWKTKTLSNWGLGQPKPENVAQAAHYMWQHGSIPGLLVYTSRAWHALKAKEEDLAQAEHRAILGGGGWTYGVKPFVSLYELEWRDEVLYMDGKKTVITVQGIKDYYVMLGDCLTNKTIPDFHYKDMWGGTVNKKKHEQYFEWADVPTDDWDEWVNEIKSRVDQLWSEIDGQI